uniref:Uncharacterized protein n=1 Tax=Arundo donax TaxID=35708 RepID=A0A0A9CFF1_ARUDO
MRRLVVAELVVLAAAAAAFAVGLLLLLYLLWRRGGRIFKRPLPPELPLSRGDPRPLPCPTKRSRCRVHQLLLMLCSGRRRARVEPASTPNSAEPSPAEEEVAAWRERWFGPASRALYTIHEEDEVESTGGERREEEPEPEPDLETPFYTPPASPPQLISAPAPAAEDAAS